MNERSKIEERLQRKEGEIRTLEEKLKQARTYVQALRDVLGFITDGDEDGQTTTPSDTALRSGSAVAQARSAIIKSGTPIHINELLVALGKEATREQRASLIGSLSAYVRRREIFTRPAPNTFGLIELGHKSSDEGTAEGPPAGFGRVSTVEEPDTTNST